LQQQPLLGHDFNAPEGNFPVPLTKLGYQARRAVIAKVEAGAYQLERSPCLCGGHQDCLICTVDRYRIPHRTVLCEKCGLIRTDPRWTRDSYNDFYRNYYRAMYERPGHDAQTIFAVQSSNARARSAFIMRQLAGILPDAVLEIGCGGGWNLLPFHERGSRVVGYDFDEDYLRAGRERGMDLRTGDIETARRDKVKYDLIILSHVVEHFLEPVSELRQVSELLTPGGVLFVEVPNLFEVDGQLLRYWQAAHTYSFVPGTLRLLMGQAGYAEIALSREIRSMWRATDAPPRSHPHDPRLAGQIKRFLISRQRDTRVKLLTRGVRNRVLRMLERT
jgi:2-polyprenyl-3-methyl-5-hydroxy-6-metoxy-1,4-benzoquinol methylase